MSASRVGAGTEEESKTPMSETQLQELDRNATLLEETTDPYARLIN